METYSKTGIWLHWVSALLVLLLWPMGKLMDQDSTGFSGAGLYTLHIWIGLAVCVMTIARVVLHFAGPQPDPLPMPKWEKVLTVVNHYGLYLCLLALSVSGIAMLVGASYLPLPGESFKPSIFENKAEAAAEFHEAPGNILMLLMIMHVIGVVYYQVTQGRTLRRMGVPVAK